MVTAAQWARATMKEASEKQGTSLYLHQNKRLKMKLWHRPVLLRRLAPGLKAAGPAWSLQRSPVQGSRTSSRNGTSLNPETNKRNVEEGVKKQSKWRLRRNVRFKVFLVQKLHCWPVFIRTAKVNRRNLQRTEGSFRAVPDFIASHIYKAGKKIGRLSDGKRFQIRCEIW